MPRLIIRSSDIHAAGCFALEPVAKGTRLLEYTASASPRTKATALRRPALHLPVRHRRGDMVIDGHGMAMFVNHSCQPNCETDEIDGRVYIQPSATSRRARNSPTTTGSMTATMRPPATAAARNAAAACTLPQEMKKQKAPGCRAGEEASRGGKAENRKVERQGQTDRCPQALAAMAETATPSKTPRTSIQPLRGPYNRDFLP